MASKEDIIAHTRSWLGTPYKNQASCRGVGADCLGLVRGVYRHFVGSEPEAIPPYRPEWYDVEVEDLLLRKAGEYMRTIPLEDAGPADVLVFRPRKNMAAKHCGIIVSSTNMVHAMSRRKIEEVSYLGVYLRKVVGAFRFEFLED